jgi:hypothetical protein
LEAVRQGNQGYRQVKRLLAPAFESPPQPVPELRSYRRRLPTGNAARKAQGHAAKSLMETQCATGRQRISVRATGKRPNQGEMLRSGAAAVRITKAKPPKPDGKHDQAKLNRSRIAAAKGAVNGNLPAN